MHIMSTETSKYSESCWKKKIFYTGRDCSIIHSLVHLSWKSWTSTTSFYRNCSYIFKIPHLLVLTVVLEERSGGHLNHLLGPSRQDSLAQHIPWTGWLTLIILGWGVWGKMDEMNRKNGDYIFTNKMAKEKGMANL